MPFLLFPPILMRESVTERPRLVGTARGSRSVSGVATMSRSDGGGLWTFGLSNIAINRADHVKLYELMSAYLGMGEVPIIVEFCNARYAPFPVVDGRTLYSYDPIPHSDGSFFGDGSGYYQSVIDAVLLSGAALRATTLTLRINFGGALRGNDLFSLVHPVKSKRMYTTTSVEQINDTDYTVKISPPLREDTDAQAVADFDKPGCVMQLDGPMALSLEQRKFGRPSIRFVESFLPPP